MNDSVENMQAMMDKGEKDAKTTLHKYMVLLKQAECDADPNKCFEEATDENIIIWEYDQNGRRIDRLNDRGKPGQDEIINPFEYRDMVFGRI